MRKSVWMELEINAEILADQISEELSQSDLLEFLLLVDAHVADTSFTELLIQNLQESLEGEGE